MTISFFQDANSTAPSPNSREQHTKTHLKQDIEEFLAVTSQTAPRSVICSKCGRALPTVNLTFSLYGSDKQWNIPLPLCPCAHSTLGRKRVSETGNVSAVRTGS